MSDIQQNEKSPITDVVVRINRCAKVVKGGRRFSFSSLVVAGDGKGRVGLGSGKAKEVPATIKKGQKTALKNMVEVRLHEGGTIAHPVKGTFGSTIVYLYPASLGTGIIACAAVRSVIEKAGYHNVMTKVHGSTNPTNVVKATLDGLKKIKDIRDVEKLRGVKLR